MKLFTQPPFGLLGPTLSVWISFDGVKRQSIVHCNWISVILVLPPSLSLSLSLSPFACIQVSKHLKLHEGLMYTSHYPTIPKSSAGRDA